MMKSTLSIEEINDIDELRKLINILNNKIELIESSKKHYVI